MIEPQCLVFLCNEDGEIFMSHLPKRFYIFFYVLFNLRNQFCGNIVKQSSFLP